MPRQPRLDASGALHHVVAKGNSGESIVRNDFDRQAFVRRLSQAVARYRWKCLAYCLLDTHFHLIVATPQPTLSAGMRWLKATYAQDMNHRHGRTGHLFGGRFYSKTVESDDHLIAALIYVLLNPVRAGAVDSPRDWSWSSCAATLGAAPSPRFLDTAAVLELFGRDAPTARVHLEAALEETLALDREPRGQTRRV
jgi:REP-associated tyrosine transposase